MSNLKFKTNIKCEGCISNVTAPLNDIVGNGKWRIDLSDPLRTLFVEGEINENVMKEALEKRGYKVDRIN